MANNFSFDKQALQKTLAVLDTSNKVEDVVGHSPKLKTSLSANAWFVRILMESLCAVFEKDPDKREALFKAFEKKLVHKKILTPKMRLENLTSFRRDHANMLLSELVELRSSCIPNPKDTSFITNLFNERYIKKFSNTYEDNFKELQDIGKGGFGRVYKVRHKVDRCVYAVKKIIFKFEHEEDYSKVISEVESISRLNHKNIVSYKNCWIQHPSDSDEARFAEDDSGEDTDFSVEQTRNPKCSTVLNLAAGASNMPCSPNSKTTDGNSWEENLNFNCNKRISFGTSECADSSTISTNDQTPSISLNDQNIIYDSIPSNKRQRRISASINFGDESILNVSITSEGSWLSTSECNLELKKNKCGSWFRNPSISSDGDSSPNSSVHIKPRSSSFRNPAICSSDSNPNHSVPGKSSSDGNSSPESDSSLDRSPPDLEDDEIIFSNRCRDDSTYSLALPSHDLNGTLHELDETTLEDYVDFEYDDETPTKHESIQNTVNDKETSTLEGDFGKVLMPRCKTSPITSWSSNSMLLSRTSFTINDVNFCLESNGATSPLHFQFKPANLAMLCIQMEYCDCDLKQWLELRSFGESLPFIKDIKDIFKEILNGVAYIHSKSIIHRDLKPANIFYSKTEDSMKIGDFGLATLSHYSPRQAKKGKPKHFTSRLGTAPYAAPEQMKKNNYDNKVDIYSLGIILFELMCRFRTTSEFYREIGKSLQGDFTEELTSQHPSYIELFQNLTQKDASLRMPAKEILNLPIFQDDLEDKTLLMQEIKDLKVALELERELRQEFKKALTEKDAIIEELRREIKELSVMQKLKSKKGQKKH